MPHILVAQGYKHYARLIVDLLLFMAPHLHSPLTDPVRLLYKGTLRILLVLLHDYPEFLCGFHATFMDAIPTTCVQLRNLVLSAFPVGLKLPDPFTVDYASMTSTLEPVILSDISLPPALKSAIDNYTQTRSPAALQAITLPERCGGLVLHLATHPLALDIYTHLLATSNSRGEFILTQTRIPCL